ncbi:hypothetical protein P5673_003602 [Acropora cervicornis]|uniref:Uncharacterized protein n=1 Tax=Acropora cervicornis TaxID=6130 RepID=A0AAD9VE48_ACRCE|nr:hypothetical protein P5673_003602 [Acropora cervicornis]
MTKHSMTGIQSLNNFSFECTGLRVWKACDALAAVEEGQGGSTGDTHWAKVAEDQPSPCKVVCLDCAKTIFVNVSKACFSRLTCTRARGRVKSSVPLDDHYQVTLQSVTPLAKKRARDVENHLVELERENNYNTIKWAETCEEMCASYVNYSTVASFSSPVAVSADSPVSLGWALKWTRISIGFTGNFKVRLKKAFGEGEETGRKASPSDVASKFDSNSNWGKSVRRKGRLVAKQVAIYLCRP